MRRIDWKRIVIWVVSGAILAYLLWRLRFLIIVLILSAVLAYFLRPGVEFLCRLRLPLVNRPLPRILSVVLVFLALGGAIFLFGKLTHPTLVRETREISLRLSHWKRDFPAFISRLRRAYKDFLPKKVQESLEKRAWEWADSLVKGLGKVATATFRSLYHSVQILVGLLLIPVLAFYFLTDPGTIKSAFLAWFSPRHRDKVEDILSKVDKVFGAYIVGQIILCFIAFVVVTLILYAFRLKFFLLLGLFAGIARAIPIVGPIVSGIPIVLVAWLNSWLCALEVLVLFSLLHFVESKFVMPYVIGYEVGLHPVEIIIALLFAEEFFGLVGMFVAAPVVAAIKVLLRGFYSQRAGTECAS